MGAKKDQMVCLECDAQIKDQARLGVQAESDGVHFSVRSTALELDGRFQWAVKVINLISSHSLTLLVSPCTHHLHNFHISSCSRAPAQKYLTDARCCDRRVSFRSAKLDETSVFSFQLYVIYVILLPAVCMCVCVWVCAGCVACPFSIS